MKASLLILNGDRWQRESMAAALAYEGWHAEHTGDAISAMALLARHRFQLVLLDPSAQSTGGWATIERLMLLRPELPVIVFAPIEEEACLALLTGVSGSIVKPIDSSALLSAIRRALSSASETSVTRPIKRETPLNSHSLNPRGTAALN